MRKKAVISLNPHLLRRKLEHRTSNIEHRIDKNIPLNPPLLSGTFEHRTSNIEHRIDKNIPLNPPLLSGTFEHRTSNIGHRIDKNIPLNPPLLRETFEHRTSNIGHQLSYILFLIVILIWGCSSIPEHHDDAVRIKESAANKYNKNPFTGALRNGNSLRGTVLRIAKTSYPDSCPINEYTHYITKGYVVFLDSLSILNNQIEEIPIEDVDLIGPKLKMPLNVHNNINYFEDYNNPLNPKSLREVLVDSVFIDTCSSCNCAKFDVPGIKLKCPERICSWYFLELRAGYAVYPDYKNSVKLIGRDALIGEIATGIRLGEARQWGIGLAGTYGLNAYNSQTGEDIPRPTLLLHIRYDTYSRCLKNKVPSIQNKMNSPDLSGNTDSDNSFSLFSGTCIHPFVFGQFGAALDNLSINLFKLNFSKNCKDKITANGEPPGIDLGLPLSFGLGAGFDLPLTPWFDLSADLSFRSIAFGESMNLLGFTNVPTKRRINMLVFRVGLTL